MSFLSPLAFLLLALSLPLLLLYFLKVRRRERSVSSVLLWEPALREREASTFFQRLQRDPLILLQLLALLALATALARPVVAVKGQGAPRTVLILDASASMKATDVLPSRFAAAQREALAWVGRLPRGAEVMVIEAGSQPRVVAPFSRDRRRIASAVKGLEARDLPNRLREAIRTARALTAREPRAEIRIFSDGAHTLSAGDGRDDPRVRWVGIGRRGRNVGVTHLAVRKTFYDASGYQAFASIVNFSDEPQSFTFTLDLDGRSVAEQALTLEPHVRRAVVIPFSHPGGGVAGLRLGVRDDLEADNVAYAVIPPPAEVRVLLVSPGNLFLEKALAADPQVRLEVRTPDAYPGGMESFDVVVLDGAAPARIGPGRYILINTIPPDVPLEGLGQIEQPVILDWDRTHPIMRHVDFGKVVIEQGQRVRPLAAGKSLLEAVGGPLVYVLEETGRKTVFFGFDLFRTDFPLRVAFPVMLSNALRWLHPAGVDPMSFQVRTGQPILLGVQHGVTAVRVTTPSGRSVEAKVTRGLASFTDTSQVGVYTLSTGRGITRVAANLADAQESDVAPRPLPPRPEGRTAGEEAVVFQRELWGVFVLLAAVLLGVEGLLYWRRQTEGRHALPGAPRDRWVLGFRGVLVILLLVSLLRPTVPRWVDRLNVLFLLDVSDSVSLAARERAYRFAAQALTGMQGDDQAGLVVFGREAVVDQPLAPKPKLERPLSTVPGRGTNLAQALQVALGTLPADHANRLVLLSDGRQNEGDALAAAQAAKDAGVDIYYAATPLTFTQEVVAEAMLLPEEVKFGEPFETKVVVWSQRETGGRLSLFRNGEFVGSQVIRLAAGKNVYTYRQSLEQSGIHVYQASVEVEGDTVQENNRAVGTLLVRGRPQVLLAEKHRDHAQALRAALRVQHIEVDVVEPEGIPRDPTRLRKYDALILSNVSSLKLTKKQMEEIRDYVRDGGGLVMVGGEESFGLGGYYRTPIEEALPVTMEVKQRIEIPSLAVVLSMDRSGSMAMSTDDKVTKLDIAKEAAHLVVDLLDERNEVGVMSWDTEFLWDVPLQPARNRPSIHHAIATIKAGGGTDGYPALKEAYRALYERQALLKHVIFLSDGQMTRGDFSGLIRRMAKDKITVSSVAIGRDSDAQLMFDIAKWGRGRFYYTEDTQTIPRIFTLETQLASKASLVEQPFKPVLSSGGHEIVQDIDWNGAPPLGGYVSTTLKGSAEQLLMTPQEDPLLAAWRYGLGRAVAFTSDAKAKWAVLWLRWGAFNKFWGQLTRWTLRTASRSDAVATVERRDATGEVMVEAVDQQGQFINFLEAQLGVVAPDKQQVVVDLEQVAPGRYRGRFPAGEEGVYLLGMAQRRGDEMLGSQLMGLVVPYAQELKALEVDETLLRELAELTGGGALGEPRDAFLRSRRRSRLWVELWPWIVGGVAGLLLPEIALRRIGPGLRTRWPARAGGGAPAGSSFAAAEGGGHGAR